ncbi:MAG TPA: hypothetical protein VH877_14835 [Polyangia bacterium]|jgi:hypothetical protein|nr:hypothetical protein [Polyangia bacterium]
MRFLDSRLSRRALLERLGLAALLVPLWPLARTAWKLEQRRRREQRLAEAEDFWIGHC